MKNFTEIHTDGICVYINSAVGAKLMPKLILLFLNIVVFTLLFWALSNVEDKEIGKAIIGTITFMVILFYTLIKYTLWNFWGQEFIIVNDKTISYQFDYGFYRTNLKTFHFNRLGTGYEYVRDFDNEPEGKFLFFDYDKDKIPHLIFNSTILMNEESISRIDEKIVEVFVNELNLEYNFIPYSQN